MTTAPPHHDLMGIGEAARRAGISPDALRYYEEQELIRVARSASGQRRYSAQDLEWIGVLTCLRETGMPIRRMREFAALVREADEATVGERLRVLLHHRAEVTSRIAALQDNRARLDRKITWYRDHLPGPDARSSTEG